jgi:pimeloyl-ACP methyl ester carboxylesterase
VLAVVLAVLTAGCTRGPDGQTREPPSAALAQEAAARFERVTDEALTASDGTRLHGRLYHAVDERLLILLHGYRGSSDDWVEFIAASEPPGWVSMLALDFRGHGTSEGDSGDAAAWLLDVRAAIDFGRERGYQTIALAGASAGGTAAIIAAGTEPVAGVVALSAPVRFGDLDADEAAANVERLAIMASRGDPSAADALGRFRELAMLGPFDSRLFEGRAHGVAMLYGEDGAEVRAELLAKIGELWPN